MGRLLASIIDLLLEYTLMSDDLSSQLNPVTPPNPPASVPPVSSATPPPLGSNIPAADIFASVDRSTPPPAAPITPLPEVTPRPLEPLSSLPELEAEDGRKRVFVWVGVVVAIAIVGIGGWFAYAQLLAPSTPIVPGEQPIVETPSEQPVVETPATDDDFDRDGLTNAEEQQLQTDPYNADTDADGLYDREEVTAWHTDPLNPDSDGDGYLDGAEVANGFNPKGSGPLLELPTSTAP
jgi:hypothetical protein